MAKKAHKVKKLPKDQRLHILLSNGRFPVSLDLARQLHRMGHTVFVADPMEYHVCKFSRCVRKSFYVPAPHYDAAGYISGIRDAISSASIDLLIPMHEEIFFLTQHPDLQKICFAPSYASIVSMHNKWEFSRVMRALGIDTPETRRVTSMEDVRRELGDDFAGGREWALKPVFGRASSKVYHLKPGKPLPDDCDVAEDNVYILQEWTPGRQLCSYAVARRGHVMTSTVYPVLDTIDGASSVYFKAIEHPPIMDIIEKIVKGTAWTGQIAFDFVEGEDGRVCVIECNPRSTSGIHLYKGTPYLSSAFTLGPAPSSLSSPSSTNKPATTTTQPPPSARRQVMPGMLMWSHSSASLHDWLTHLVKLMGTRDVTFSRRDVLPALMQPFLLTSYYEICRERKLELKTMFQDDVVWVPGREELEEAERLREGERREWKCPPLLDVY
ncbi:hypothetical protein SAICODRAFT_98195 [Saitoella complicata NRRL Y-17804]|uniref:uncharacterized protein n=1 Tax=Saitoella complicata (strain BCRC 22490 / CBS 7301 / JCM 7358 / NBRC 10748 / NRRL Y-17804) TaxID=698492 RepID=UPI00086702D4|nr:uncharacterized protein SAICODRAFT_98195 [Saitoella complicata NRRL Y-17804]ODQ49786.1 hypothetical protein SAICODRAFT_98195 [Saitoella complicata NRRL Y-17804]